MTHLVRVKGVRWQTLSGCEGDEMTDLVRVKGWDERFTTTCMNRSDWQSKQNNPLSLVRMTYLMKRSNSLSFITKWLTITCKTHYYLYELIKFVVKREYHQYEQFKFIVTRDRVTVSSVWKGQIHCQNRANYSKENGSISPVWKIQIHCHKRLGHCMKRSNSLSKQSALLWHQ